MTESTSSKTVSTPDLYDQFPDQVEVLPPIFSNYGGITEFYGQIVTVKCFEDNSMVKKLVGQPGAGKVMVVDGGGSLRRALLGDMLAEQAAANHWAGLIIYGCIRDVDQIKATPIGVQAVNTIPVRTEKRGLGDIDIPVEIGGIKIHPGAFVYADNNGILIAAQPLL